MTSNKQRTAFIIAAFATSLAISIVSPAKPGGDIEHIIVSHSSGEFAGWPANEGCWAWGDEILAGYTVGRYKDRGTLHSIDPEGPEQLCFSRSLDGGRTWARETSVDARAFRKPAEGESRAPGVPANIDFQSDTFALKLRYDRFHLSMNRGKSWSGPRALPAFGDPSLVARSNYIITGRDSALVFLTSSPVVAPGRRGRSFVAAMRDGGRHFEFISWIGSDPGEGLPEREWPAFSTMPAAVQIAPGHFVCALRQRVNKRKWTDIYESKDNARTWRHISVLEKGAANPAAMVHLGGGKLAAVYGWRNKPYGIRAKISTDAGRTWGGENILRKDGRTWDLGYPRTVLRADGAVVVLYYFTTEERPEQHIAATIWNPGIE
ncbi:MAG: glycoside hydrolase [Opitutaceae bacterium]|jgi:hypothetical protein|nr:glycoside hydrolase [Opitutaceae bacterium]